MNETDKKEFFKLFNDVDENVSSSCDKFFENQKFFPGNVIGQKHLPYDRFEIYESNLKLLRETFSGKFDKVHKGTPYYFLGWTAFDFRDYERAIFYMDAAISEDARIDPLNWQNRPASQFLFLKSSGQVAERNIKNINNQLSKIIKEFNNSFSSNLSVEDFISKFVNKNLNDKTHRSIITSMYSFSLELDDRLDQLKIRSIDGGSLEPFLTHLFKGCLVFESILKEVYTSFSTTELGSILKDQFVSQDLQYKNSLIDNTAGVRKTLQDIVRHLLPYLKKEKPQDRCITITYAIRNTTSHSLLWSDVFINDYKDICEAILFSCFYIIIKKY